MHPYDRFARRSTALLCALAVGLTWLAITSRGQTDAAGSTTRDRSSWAVPSHDAQRTNFNPVEQTIGPALTARLHTVWSVRYVYQAIATATRVYAITQEPLTHTRLLVLEARSGRLLHAYTAAALHIRGYSGSVQDTWFQSLAYAHDKLVVGATNEVIALDAETGHVYWRVRGGAFGLTIEGGILYTTKTQCQNPCGPAADSAIELQTGRVLWKHPNHGQGSMLLAAGRLVQQFVSMGIGPAGPAFLYDARSGRLLDTLSLGGERAYWTGDASSLYAMGSPNPYPAGSPRGKQCGSWVQRLSPRGERLWKLCMSRQAVFVAPPVLGYRTLYAVMEDSSAPPGGHDTGLPTSLSGSVVAISTETGRVRWRSTQWHYPHGVSPDFMAMVAANHLLFVETRGPGQVTVIDARTGRLIRRFLAPGYWGQPDSWPMLVAGGTIYAGHLIAFRP